MKYGSLLTFLCLLPSLLIVAPGQHNNLIRANHFYHPPLQNKIIFSTNSVVIRN